jgi:hypothetical protein
LLPKNWKAHKDSCFSATAWSSGFWKSVLQKFGPNYFYKSTPPIIPTPNGSL